MTVSTNGRNCIRLRKFNSLSLQQLLNDRSMKIFFVLSLFGFLVHKVLEVVVDCDLSAEVFNDLAVSKPNQVVAVMLMDLGIKPVATEVYSNREGIHKTIVR
jgi:hypothetical protein